MKCPKCGNTNLTIERRPNGGTICNICLFSGKATEFNKELSTAEKLLWLAKNFNIKIDGKFLTKIQIYDGLNNKIVFLEISKDINELIVSAYEWAKQREG